MLQGTLLIFTAAPLRTHTRPQGSELLCAALAGCSRPGLTVAAAAAAG
jgi:hypothetical protein